MGSTNFSKEATFSKEGSFNQAKNITIFDSNSQTMSKVDVSNNNYKTEKAI
jgi:hypothetical protein